MYISDFWLHPGLGCTFWWMHCWSCKRAFTLNIISICWTPRVFVIWAWPHGIFLCPSAAVSHNTNAVVIPQALDALCQSWSLLTCLHSPQILSVWSIAVLMHEFCHTTNDFAPTQTESPYYSKCLLYLLGFSMNPLPWKPFPIAWCSLTRRRTLLGYGIAGLCSYWAPSYCGQITFLSWSHYWVPTLLSIQKPQVCSRDPIWLLSMSPEIKCVIVNFSPWSGDQLSQTDASMFCLDF